VTQAVFLRASAWKEDPTPLAPPMALAPIPRPHFQLLSLPHSVAPAALVRLGAAIERTNEELKRSRHGLPALSTLLLHLYSVE